MNWKKNPKIATIALLLFAMQFFISTEPLVPTILSQVSGTPADFYKLEPIAKIGQAGIIGIEPAASINDHGTVAFVGYVSASESGVFVANGSQHPAQIAPNSGEREYSFVQINNADQIIAYDEQPSAPTKLTKIRVWNAHATDEYELIAVGQRDTPGTHFDAVFQFSSINNHGDVIFSAYGGHHAASLCISAHCLVKPAMQSRESGNPWDEIQVKPSVGALRPRLADNGQSVVKDGPQPDSPIYLNNANLLTRERIDTSGYFTETGGYPGISDDGSIVAFYGNLNEVGATALNTTPGPGIFASVRTNEGRVVRRVAGIQGLGSLADFDPDAPLSVNNARKFVYIAYDTQGHKGIYASQLTFFSIDPYDPTAFTVTAPPALVAAEGTKIPGVGTVQDVFINDSLNNKGQVAFWVTTNTNIEAVVRAQWQCPHRDYANPLQATYINQYDAGEEHDLPKRFGERGGNACGPSSLTTLINTFYHAGSLDNHLDLLEVYRSTMKNVAADDIENPFVSAKAKSHVKSLGFNSFSISSKSQLDRNLASGMPVLVSTRYTSKRYGSYGGGHIILFWGRTADGDYVVSDPAGDYYSSAENHYGPEKCGEYVIYPQDEIAPFFETKEGSAWRWGLAISPLQATSREFQPTTAIHPSRGNEVLLVIGSSSELESQPFQLWLEDESGQRAGFLSDGTIAEEIPNSLVEITPLITSDPDSTPEEEIDANIWPYAISIPAPDDSIRAFVQGKQATDFSLEIIHYNNGQSNNFFTTGSVASNELKPVSTTPPINIDSPKSGMSISEGSDLIVNLTVSGDFEIDNFTVSFDRDGNGTVDGPGEGMPVTSTGLNTYQATFTNVSGPGGLRTINVLATDLSNGTNIASITTILVESSVSDTIEPTVSIDSPTPGTLIPRGNGLTVNLTAIDDISIDSVTVSFDIDGDRIITSPGERIQATRTGSGTYQAVFADISGPSGPRTISASAEDTSGNVGVANTTVTVGGSTIAGTTPTVHIETPGSGVLMPLHSDLTIRLSVTSDVDIASVTVLFDTDGNDAINRFNEFVRANQVGPNTYEATFNNISGPPGTRLVRAFAVDSTLNIGAAAATVMVGDTTAPTVTIDWPTPGMLVPVGSDLIVKFRATDDVGIDSVKVSFDAYGDNIPAISTGSGTYEATLTNISGTDGPRTIHISATDPSLNVGVANRTITVGDRVPIVGSGTSVPYEMIFGLGSINTVAFSPDGQQALLGGSTGFAVLVNTTTWTIERHFLGHTGSITGVAFSPDGKQVLTGSDDKTVRLWDTASGALLRIITGHSDGVTSVAFSPDGAQVATGSKDRTARLWDVKSGRSICSCEGHTGEVQTVAFSPDGSQVLTGSADRTARLWQTANCKSDNQPFTGHTSGVKAVAFSPKAGSNQMLTGSSDGTARLWNVTTYENKRLPHSSSASVNAVAFSPDGTQIATGSKNTVWLWDATNGEFLRHIEGHGNVVLAVAFSPDGSLMLTGGADGTARLWESGSSTPHFTFEGDHASKTAVLSPDGRQVLTGSIDGKARVWDAVTGDVILVLEGSKWPNAVAFSNDGTRILTGGNDNTVQLWDAKTGAIIRSIAVPGNVHAVAFSSDGTKILAGSEHGVHIWDITTEELHTFEGYDGKVHSVAFSPDDQRVLAGGNDNYALLWDASSRTSPAHFSHNAPNTPSFDPDARAVKAVAFSSNGTRILTGSVDGTARLWDPAAPGQPLQTFAYGTPKQGGGTNPAIFTSVSFSPNDTQILTGHDDGTVRLWDAATGVLLRAYEGHTGKTLAVFSRDGAKILTVGADHTARLWQVTTIPMLGLPDIEPDGGIIAADWSPLGDEIITLTCLGNFPGPYSTTARLWSLEGTPLYVLFEDRRSRDCSGLVSLGSHILTLTGNSGVQIWDTSNGRQLRSLPGHGYNTRALASSADDKWVLTGGQDLDPGYCQENCASAKLWNISEGVLQRTFSHAMDVTAVAFSPDGRQILTGSVDNQARLWDVESGKEIRVFKGHVSEVTAVAYSSDGTRVLTGSKDKTVRLWDVATGTLLHVYNHPDGLKSVAFAPDKPWMVATTQHTAYVWDITEGGLMFAASHRGPISAAIFSPDGTRLLTAGGWDGVVRFWAAKE